MMSLAFLNYWSVWLQSVTVPSPLQDKSQVSSGPCWLASAQHSTQYKLIPSICRACAQSCPTLYDPMDYSPPGSSVKGILQTRILEWLPFPARICQVDNSSNLVLITPAVMTDDLIRKSLVTHTSFPLRFIFFFNCKNLGSFPQDFGKPILGSRSHNERKTSVMVAYYT